MKETVAAEEIYAFLAALGVEDPHTVRSVRIDPDKVTVYVSKNRVEDGGLAMVEHGVRIDYGRPGRHPFEELVLNEADKALLYSGGVRPVEGQS